MSAIWFTVDDDLTIRNDGLVTQTFVMDIDNVPTTVAIQPKSERRFYFKEEFKIKARLMLEKVGLEAMKNPEWMHWFLHQLQFSSKKPHLETP